MAAHASTLRELVRSDALARRTATLRTFAIHDWLLLSYLIIFFVLTAVRATTSIVPFALITFDLLWFVVVLTIVRGFGSRSTATSLLYRLTLIGVPVASYIELRWILPVIAPTTLDHALLALDLRVFGFEPALAWDSLVTTNRTEWFSFFYYSYFFLLALHTIPISLFAHDGRLLRELAFGLLFVFCVGQTFYVVVPGVGPWAYEKTAGLFQSTLEGPRFWPLVSETVASAGAGRDIFPSLHTAGPLFLTLFSFHNRKRSPFRYSWPVMAFFASQIILATMYLRWHYLADIVAGVLLASAGAVLSAWVGRWEGERRRLNGVASTFARPLVLRGRA